MVAGAKDVLFAELTGTLLTDPSTAAGFALYDLDTGRWDAELVARSGIPALPAIAPATTALRLRPQWRKRWDLPELPVVLGGADSVLGALGLGAAAHGDVAVIAGTSAIVIGVCDHPIRDEQRRYLVTPLATPGWGLEMDLLAMGSAFSGIAELVEAAGLAAFEVIQLRWAAIRGAISRSIAWIASLVCAPARFQNTLPTRVSSSRTSSTLMERPSVRMISTSGWLPL